MTGNVLLQDDVELRFGTDTDLKIYHDGANSRIANNTGHLYIQNLSDDKDILLRSDDGSGGLTTYLNVDGSLGQVSVSKPLVVTDNATISGTLYTGNTITVGDGTDDSKIIIKNFNAVSEHIEFYNGSTRVGEIGVEDNTWLRINQETNKNIYTPRYIRADAGFFVDGTAKGINGSGNFIGGTITGASDANVSNWDTAYTDRNKWDGGSTGLTASTGRTSLGLGTAATAATGDFATAAQGTTADAALPKAAGSGNKLTDTLYIQGTNQTSQESVLLRGITSDDGDWLGSIRTANTGAYNQEMRFYTSNANGTSDEDLTLTLHPTQNATFASNVYAGGDLTVAGGDITVSKQNDAPTLTLLHDGTNPSTNDLLFKMQFQSDYNGAHQNWGKIVLETNSSATRTDMDFYVKSTSGAEELGFRIQGGASTPKAYFYNDVDVDGNFTADNFSGSSSGTNTGDQDLSSYITSQRAISSTPTDGATTTAISSDWAFDNVKTAVPANALFTDANTTYSAGTGLDLTGTTFSVEPDLRDGITHVGKDSNNYIQFDSTNGRIDFYAGGVFVARMESDGDLHMKGDVIAFSDIF